MNRSALLKPILESTGETNPVIFFDWDVIPGVIDGEHVATAIIKGTEIHFAIVPSWRRRVITRRRAKDFLNPLLERRGYLTTRVLLSSEEKKRFVERIGFTPTWSDQYFQYYLLGHSPFARS